MAILEDIGIAHFAHMQATNLSYGNQRKVEIARALATAPSCSCSMSRPPG